jgi:hypothetical protein
MSEKKKLIAEMIEMQRKFIKYDREHGMRQEEYWLNEAGHPLNNFKESFADKAAKLVEMAHQEKGSKR